MTCIDPACLIASPLVCISARYPSEPRPPAESVCWPQPCCVKHGFASPKSASSFWVPRKWLTLCRENHSRRRQKPFAGGAPAWSSTDLLGGFGMRLWADGAAGRCRFIARACFAAGRLGKSSSQTPRSPPHPCRNVDIMMDRCCGSCEKCCEHMQTPSDCMQRLCQGGPLCEDTDADMSVVAEAMQGRPSRERLTYERWSNVTCCRCSRVQASKQATHCRRSQPRHGAFAESYHP